jgi:hypothetical protein
MNVKNVEFLTQDVSNLDDRIMALEVKINSFLKADYEYFTKEYNDFTDKIDELTDFRTLLKEQIQLLNDHFKMGIIEQFSDLEVVDKFKNIIYNAIGV